MGSPLSRLPRRLSRVSFVSWPRVVGIPEGRNGTASEQYRESKMAVKGTENCTSVLGARVREWRIVTDGPPFLFLSLVKH